MGLLRFLLALGVAGEHAGYGAIIGSHMAVKVFFIISGFYMAMIYQAHYAGRAAPFWLSRAWRLLPAYWCVMGLSLVYFAVAERYGIATTLSYWRDAADAMPGWMKAWLIFANVTALGADAAWFIDAQLPKHLVHYFIVPPIWTISLEMYFYLLCPWLLKRSSRTLLALAAASLAARLLAAAYGYSGNPWHARFFPFELVFFLAGVLAWRFYAQYRERIRLTGKVKLALAAYIAAISTFYFWMRWVIDAGAPQLLPEWLIYIASVPAVPLLFALTRQTRRDRAVGELSYPIYLVHYAFVIIFHHSGLAASWGLRAMWLVAGLSILHAIALHYFLQRPIDRYRTEKFVKGERRG